MWSALVRIPGNQRGDGICSPRDFALSDFDGDANADMADYAAFQPALQSPSWRQTQQGLDDSIANGRSDLGPTPSRRGAQSLF